MATHTISRHDEIVDDIVAKAAKALGSKKTGQMESFVRAFFENVADADLAKTDPDSWLGAVSSLWRFAGQRLPGSSMVRAYNPTPEEHGWSADHTIVEVITDDMPFLVDSVVSALYRLDLDVHLIIHPIIAMQRDKNGKLIGAATPGEQEAIAESIQHFQVTAQSGQDRLDTIRNALESVLGDVRAAVEDWPAMMDKARQVVADLPQARAADKKQEIEEVRSFLDWAIDNHFTFLGYEHLSVDGGLRADALGVVTRPDNLILAELQQLSKAGPEVIEVLTAADPVVVTKANRPSTIHRPVHMDVIAVKNFDAKGKVTAIHMFVGLFTSRAYGEPLANVPLLRRKVDYCVDQSGFRRGSHDHKALLHLLDTLPRDEVFQLRAEQLFDMAIAVHHLKEHNRTGLYLRRDHFGRAMTALVFMPRDRFNTENREGVQHILEQALNAKLVQFYTLVDDSQLARVHMILKIENNQVPEYDFSALVEQVREVIRNWEDQLCEALVSTHGEEKGQTLYRRYRHAFPAGYKDSFSARLAVRDVEALEQTLNRTVPGLSLYRPLKAAENELRLKIYHRDGPIPLSHILPLLENMGLRVMDEIPHRITPEKAPSDVVLIHDFGLVTADGADVDLGTLRDPFQEAFLQVWTGAMESDGFNRLVLSGGLTWRQVVILRAYAKYLQQAGIPFTRTYLQNSLVRNATIAARIVELFELMFDPDGNNKATRKRAADLETIIEADLEQVQSADDDRILRRFLNLVLSTLRTNFYQPAADGGVKDYVSFKMDSRNLDELPLPRPWREIFVYSPRMEGIHLRGGPVARGGLRWSDRPEDFRTEILGLVKAQQVKNTVIVPVGSKGGFVVKRPPAEGGRQAMLEEGIACYKMLICGLLDITDNLNKGKVIAPRRVVRLDQDDPYLVVAADKGTATFSDIANAVANSYGFWLGDAFASGGSNGYDHKGMGITARGAWESVKRHFRELNHDTQSQEFTAIGVGDMGGDVFGNGMLLSEHIRLVGAFNHLHIFVDPDPDAARTFKERQRLFQEVKGWDQYDTALISKGGGVFSRSSKSIAITPEMKALLGVQASKLTPNELINAMLKAPVDLLWFGGIGTYVRAYDESDQQVGDRANDAIRITARDLRAKVIGEGANLGCTQRGRIEYGLLGGLGNTDFIDNSAGVDCSDHEVNIKILLDSAVNSGDMTVKQRNAQLEKMTEEVGDLVLVDNYLQAQALSLSVRNAPAKLDNHSRLIRTLERTANLDRGVEFLPDAEMLAERAGDHQGLTRPELSVLLSYSKMWLYDALLASDLPDDPDLASAAVDYFPVPLRKKFAKEIQAHQLRREIVATVLTNTLVNRAGPSFVMQVMDETGMAPADIARAYYIAHEAFGAGATWREIEALDNKASTNTQYDMIEQVQGVLERATLWFLEYGKQPLKVNETIAVTAASVADLQADLDKVISPYALKKRDQEAAGLAARGVEPGLAQRVASLPVLTSACDIGNLSRQRDMPVAGVARYYFTVGPRFKLGELRGKTEEIAADTHWQKMANMALLDSLFRHQYRLTSAVLDFNGATAEAEAAIEQWEATRRPAVDRAQRLIDEILAADNVDYAMLSLASRQILSLYESD